MARRGKANSFDRSRTAAKECRRAAWLASEGKAGRRRDGGRGRQPAALLQPRLFVSLLHRPFLGGSTTCAGERDAAALSSLARECLPCWLLLRSARRDRSRRPGNDARQLLALHQHRFLIDLLHGYAPCPICRLKTQGKCRFVKKRFREMRAKRAGCNRMRAGCGQPATSSLLRFVPSPRAAANGGRTRRGWRGTRTAGFG